MTGEIADNAPRAELRLVAAAARFATGAVMEFVADTLGEVTMHDSNFEIARPDNPDYRRRPRIDLLRSYEFSVLGSERSFGAVADVARKSLPILGRPVTLAFDSYIIDEKEDGEIVGLVVPTKLNQQLFAHERAEFFSATGVTGKYVSRLIRERMVMALYRADSKTSSELCTAAEDILRKITSGTGVAFEFTPAIRPGFPPEPLADGAVSAEQAEYYQYGGDDALE